MSKRFSLSKILVILFLWTGESSDDSILIFFGYFFNGSYSLYYSYLFCWGASRGTGGERGKVCVGGTGHGHVAFLSAAETMPFFETSFLLFWCELAGSVLRVDIHGIGILGGGVSTGDRGVESNGGSG